MSDFDSYAEQYRSIRMRREDGILELTFHSDGDSLQWGEIPHEEFPRAFHDIAKDDANRVVIMTGTGDVWSARRPRRRRSHGIPRADGRGSARPV